MPIQRQTLINRVAAIALASTPLVAQVWHTPTCTKVNPPPRAGYTGGTGACFNNWKWVDPFGVTHSFPGTSSNFVRMRHIDGVANFPDPATKEVTNWTKPLRGRGDQRPSSPVAR